MKANIDQLLLLLDTLNLPGILLQVSARVGLLLLAGEGICLALRRASAATRHLVRMAVVVGIMLPPVFSYILPRWQLEVPGRFVPGSQSGSEIAFVQKALASNSIIQRKNQPLTDQPAKEDRGIQQAREALTNAPSSWTRSLLVLWFTGALVVFVRFLRGRILIARLVRRAKAINPGGMADIVSTLTLHLSLARGVTILVSEDFATPFTCGLFKPTVILPFDSAQWSTGLRRSIILHELAHVSRKDCLTQSVAQLACVIYWFNPLVWLAVRQLRRERERACDDLVLSSGTKASDYAEHLLQMASMLQRREPLFSVISFARRSQLEERLLAILDPRLARRQMSGRASSLVTLAVVGISTAFACFQITVHVADPSTTPSVSSGPLATFQQSEGRSLGNEPELRSARRIERAASIRPKAMTPVPDPGQQIAKTSSIQAGDERPSTNGPRDQGPRDFPRSPQGIREPPSPPAPPFRRPPPLPPPPSVLDSKL